MPIFWDPKNAQYVRVDEPANNGPISIDEVRALGRESLAASRALVDQWVEDVDEGLLSPDEFDVRMRTEIREEYIRQYLLGIGGTGQMTQADWGSIGGMVGTQYSPYLNDFVAALAAGEVPLGAAQVRAGMYINSGREAFERAHARALEGIAVEERWTISPVENCDDCLAFEAMGWQPIGTFPFPGQGDTQCLTNCQCHKEYRNEAGEIVG